MDIGQNHERKGVYRVMQTLYYPYDHVSKSRQGQAYQG